MFIIDKQCDCCNKSLPHTRDEALAVLKGDTSANCKDLCLECSNIEAVYHQHKAVFNLLLSTDGYTVAAIRLLRAMTGADLKGAKFFTDKYIKQKTV